MVFRRAWFGTTVGSILSVSCLSSNPEWSEGGESTESTSTTRGSTTLSESTTAPSPTTSGTSTAPTSSGTTDEGSSGGTPSCATPRTKRFAVDVFSTQSTSYEPVGDIQLPRSDDGWLVFVSARTRTAQFGRGELRYLVGGEPRGEADPLPKSGDFDMTSDEGGAPWVSLDYVPPAENTTSVSLEFRSRNRGVFATVHDARLVAARIPRDADLQFVETADERMVDYGGNIYGLEERLALTPVSAGQYLVLGTVHLSEAPGTGSVGARIVSPGPVFWPQSVMQTRPHFANTQPPMHTYVWARAVDVPEGTTNFDLEVDSSNGGGSTVEFSRLLALRTDAFASFEGTLEPAVVTVAEGETRGFASHSHVPQTECNEFIVLQGVAPTSAGSENVSFLGHETTAFNHQYSGAEMRLGFARFDRITGSDPVEFETEVTADATAPVDVREAFTYVIGP